MPPRSFVFWTRWMLAASVAMAGFGVVLVLADTRLLPGMTQALASRFWGTEALPAEALRYHRFVHTVLGAVTTAWGITLTFLVRHAFASRQRWAWSCLVLSVTSWFVLDTGGSILAGVWANAALNMLSALPLAIALVATRRAFRHEVS
jgi:hypothetical protein